MNTDHQARFDSLYEQHLSALKCHGKAIMEPTNETDLEIPEALFNLLSEAAVANGWTMQEEVVARLEASIDREEKDTSRKQKQLLSMIQCLSSASAKKPGGVSYT